MVRHWRSAEDSIAKLQETGVRPAEVSVGCLGTSEPHVLQYVLDALTEHPDEDPVFLSEEEFWHLLAVLRTVVETLHEMAGAPREIAGHVGSRQRVE